MIVIVDYGMGNLRSVQKGLEKVGAEATISDDPQIVARADKVVLPGVGAFADAMAGLKNRGLVTPIKEYVASGRPFLGICLGLQLLFTKSYEDGEYAGLDVLAGDVVRFPQRDGLKVPHMGWNQLRIRRRSPILQGLENDTYVYFVHSYYVVPSSEGVIATETDYPTPFVSSIWCENVYATQFHPEKSQSAGLQMLRNFASV
ncbi:MAG: imidazole glycerol phosphate synthase subunit HisH [Planctomycetes bacterium]|nr:imidazole glycerol phosphate synthase subunit HisH [Planctomycetota bacterium]